MISNIRLKIHWEQYRQRRWRTGAITVLKSTNSGIDNNSVQKSVWVCRAKKVPLSLTKELAIELNQHFKGWSYFQTLKDCCVSKSVEPGEHTSWGLQLSSDHEGILSEAGRERRLFLRSTSALESGVVPFSPPPTSYQRHPGNWNPVFYENWKCVYIGLDTFPRVPRYWIHC